MKVIISILCIIGFAFADTVDILDGKTLEGWHGDSSYWTVIDGVITGESSKTNPCGKSTYLTYTKKQFANFELQLSFRFLSNSGNSGIQYRSSWNNKDSYTVKGYQADIEVGEKYSGILYEQGGRRILANRGEQVLINLSGEKIISKTLDDQAKKAQESIKPGEWNTYRIVADGDTLTHQINGFTTISVTDRHIEGKSIEGLLALQLHAGPAMKVEFKDITVLELNETLTQAPEPQWIWADKTSQNQKITLSRDFMLDKVPAKLNLNFSADDSALVSINGKKVAELNNWRDAVFLDVSSFLKKGINSISVEAFNQSGIGGLCLRLGEVLSSDELWVYLENSQLKPVKVLAAHSEQPWGEVLLQTRKETIKMLV